MLPTILPNSFQSALENIYISPLETCNLNCKLCYTHKTKNILTNQQILNFIKRYTAFLKSENCQLKSVLFCGGEVFTLKNFPRLINKLHILGIFTSIITNGTVDRLTEIKDPKNCQLLVSLDGPRDIHDQNRGRGNFDKSVKFIDHALKLGFPVEIMYLVTPQSYQFIDTFKIKNLDNNFLTQKTYFYTANHPLANQKNTKPALTPTQIINLKENYLSLPAKNFGCFQLSLQSNGKFYGCCESPLSIGNLSDKVTSVIKHFTDSLSPCLECGKCNGCCNPQFLCGYIAELNVAKCTDVVAKFT